MVSFINFKFDLFEIMIKTLERATMIIGYTEHENNPNKASQKFLRNTQSFIVWLNCHIIAEEIHGQFKFKEALNLMNGDIATQSKYGTRSNDAL